MTNVYLVQAVDNFYDEVYSTLDKVYSTSELAFQEAKRRNTENYNEAVCWHLRWYEECSALSQAISF